MIQETSISSALSGKSGCDAGNRGRAFNLLEMLVVMLLIGIFVTVSYTALDRTLPRYKLRGKATEVSGFLQKARLGAIKLGGNVTVEPEVGGSEDWLVAFRVNTDGTKTELYRLNIGTVDRESDLHLAGVEGASGGAELANTFESPAVLTYKNTGNAAKVGAFRISLGKGKHQNTIEVAVQSLGGQPVLRKYIQPSDRPTSDLASEFFEETHYGTSWSWSWY